MWTSRTPLAEALVRVAALGPAGENATDRTRLRLDDRYVEAARYPRMCPVVAEYDDRIEALLADVRRMARLVLAAIGGALLRALA